MIFCPGQECDKVIILFESVRDKINMKETSITLNCVCGNLFCGRCKEIGHRPLTCELYQDWNMLTSGKNSAKLDELCIKLNTKPCPKCKIAIEKNQGCMHITCY